MSKIIVISNQKGGAGKTTITMQIAGGLSQKKKKVLIIDGDPQNTAVRWSSTASDSNPFPCSVINLSAAGDKIHREIKNFFSIYDYILVDCPPAADSMVAQSALLVADICLIPVIPSPPDIWASVAIKETVKKALVINEDIKTYILLNQYQAHLSMTKEIIPLLEHFEFPLLKAKIGLRTVYKESAAMGTTVFLMGHKGKQASQEIENLINEILIL